MHKILFIGHEGSRTGAPIALLNTIRALKEKGVTGRILLVHGGTLAREYNELLPTEVLWRMRAPTIVIGRNMFVTLLSHFWNQVCVLIAWVDGRIRLAVFMNRVRQESFDAVYLNCIVSAKIIKHVLRLKAPLIANIHELPFGMQYGAHPIKMASVRAESKSVIVPAECVKYSLVRIFGYDASKISVIPEAVIDPASEGVSTAEASGVRARFNIPANAFVVGMSGTTREIRKGVGTFVGLARTLVASDPRFHFLWVGASTEDPDFVPHLRLKYGIDDALMSHIHFTGEQPSAAPYLAVMDIFALTSWEDPLPLVHMEAALLEKPIVCFAGTGGAPEWIGDAGVVVPYQDIDAMAQAIIDLSRDDQRRMQMGTIGREMMLRETTPGVVAERKLAIINAL